MLNERGFFFSERLTCDLLIDSFDRWGIFCWDELEKGNITSVMY